jgi:hypothetical protein
MRGAVAAVTASQAAFQEALEGDQAALATQAEALQADVEGFAAREDTSAVRVL